MKKVNNPLRKNPSPLFSHVLLIVNPTAGLPSKRKKLALIIEDLRHTAERLEIVYTTAALDATRFIREKRAERWTLILCAGGDGTINEVINGLMEEGGPMPLPPLGILPTGTGNGLAREIGLPLNPWKAYQALLYGAPRPISIGKVSLGTAGGDPSRRSFSDHRYFVLLAGAGFDGYVSRWVERRGRLYRKLPKLSVYFLFCAAALFTYSYPMLRFSIDGKVYTGWVGVIAKARLVVGPFVFAPASNIQSPLFTLCILKSKGIPGVLRLLLELLLYRRPGGTVAYIEGKQIEVLERGGEIQADGEPLGNRPALFTIADKRIELLYPS